MNGQLASIDLLVEWLLSHACIACMSVWSGWCDFHSWQLDCGDGRILHDIKWQHQLHVAVRWCSLYWYCIYLILWCC